MTRSLLVTLDDAAAFRPLLDFARLAAVHVPFDELTGHRRFETRLASEIRKQGNVVVVGPPGVGKSSLWSWTLDPNDGVFAIPVPVAAFGGAAVDVNDVAALVLHAFALFLRDVQPATADSAERMALPARPKRWRAEARFDLGPLHASVQRQIAEIPNRLDERKDSIAQILTDFESRGATPVLVLDDTDKWIDDDGEPEAAVRTFFRDVVRWVAELPSAMIVNAHTRYVDHLGSAWDWFDERILLPRISRLGLRRILDRRIEVFTDGAAGVEQIFELSVLDAFADWYVEDPSRSLRSMVNLASLALTEAVIAGKERIDLADAAAAMIDLS